MAGNKEGGKEAARTTKKLYGKDFYSVIGKKGGAGGHTGGFYRDPERARIIGAVGGLVSRTPNAKTKPKASVVRAAKRVMKQQLDIMKRQAQGSIER